MTRKITRELTIVTYRVVEEISDDDKPSLPPAPAERAYDTTGEDVTHVRGPGLAKCLPSGSRRMVAGGR